MMNRSQSVYAVFAALLATVDARSWHQPKVTAASDFAYTTGFPPKPTFAPAFHEALLRRAGSSTSDVVLVAPDNTCGFISGLAGAAYTCNENQLSETCVFFTSSTAAGHVACCNAQDCNARATCIDYNEYFSQSKCDNGCAVDTFTLKCTNTALPYCNTISFPGDIFDVFCNNLNISVVQAALTTYSGESARQFASLTLTSDSATTASSAARSASAGSGSGSSATSPNNGGSNSNGQDDNGNGNGGGGGSKTPVGPIVGGVVGGVAGLALISLAIFYFLRRNRSSSTPQPQTQIPPAYQPLPMQQNQQGFQDPKFTALPAQQQPYPPPNQQYVQPQAFYAAPQAPMSPPESHMDPRMGVAQTSISPNLSDGYAPPQQNVIHEVSSLPSDHHGPTHELA